MVGDDPNDVAIVLAAFAGRPPEIVGDQSVVENQSDYLSYDEYGWLQVHEQLPDQPEPWGIPPDLPSGPTDRTNRVDTALSALEIGINGLEGLETADQVDANRSYVGDVVFQQAGDQRCAIIQLAQLRADEETGAVSAWQGLAEIDENGDLALHSPEND